MKLGYVVAASAVYAIWTQSLTSFVGVSGVALLAGILTYANTRITLSRVRGCLENLVYPPHPPSLE